MLVPELTAVLQIVSALQWSTITVIYSEVETDKRWDAQLLKTGLDQGVSPLMVSWSALAALMAPDGSRTCLPPESTAFLLLGHDAYVMDVLSQVTSCTTNTSQTYRLFSTEWITVSSHQNRSRIVAAARAFENCALVTYTQNGKLSLWTIRQDNNNSHLSFVASFPPRGPTLTRRLILPNPYHGLGGRTLRVALKTSASILSLRQNGGQDVYSGIIMDIFTALAHSLNFSYTVVPLVDGSWGQELDDGQWDGPIGMLTRQEIDMAVGYFTITAERSRVADHTSPFHFDNTVLVFRTPAVDGPDRELFLKPFQSAVYLVVAAALVVVLMLLLLLDTCQDVLHEAERTAVRDGRLVRTLDSLVVNVEILLAGLVNKACSQTSASRGGRVLVVTWLMLGVVLTSLYSSQLTSTLTAGGTPLPFTSLAELLQQDAFKFGVAANTSQQTLLKTSTVKEYQLLYQRILELSETDPDVLSTDIRVHEQKIMRENFASLQGSTLLISSWQNESCGQLTLLPEQFRTATIGFYLQRGSPYTEYVSERINRIVDAGLVEHWKKQASHDGHCPMAGQEGEEEGRSARRVGLTDTYTAFCLAAAGLGVAAIILGAERLALVYKDRSGQR